MGWFQSGYTLEKVLHSLQEAIMSVSWNKNVDSALHQASEENKPLFLDFSAAPM